jgi:c-di-GMP-binding flagellar brake protein YcgR
MSMLVRRSAKSRSLARRKCTKAKTTKICERRREVRFAISAQASVETLHNRHTIRATTIDLSGGGVRLKLEDGRRLDLGDKVMCEFKILNAADASMPFWGVGTVVRIGHDWAAVHFEGGGFNE